MRGVILAATLLAMALGGCLQPQTSGAGEETAATTATDAGGWVAPLMTRSGCSGFNAILFTDDAAMRPYVPANWTFTAFGNQAILRILVAGCEAAAPTDEDPWDYFLIMSTPMSPDEASLDHHVNPDVVLGFWADNATSVAAMDAHGVVAREATFDWTETPTGDTIHVNSEDGHVLQFEGLNPHQSSPTTQYVWPAAYAAGTTNITWFWGHENATARVASVMPPTFGPASPVPGIATTPWSIQVWMGFDVTYAPGTPPKG